MQEAMLCRWILSGPCSLINFMDQHCGTCHQFPDKSDYRIRWMVEKHFDCYCDIYRRQGCRFVHVILQIGDVRELWRMGNLILAQVGSGDRTLGKPSR